MKHNGWRKPTPGLVVAEQHAQVGEQLYTQNTGSRCVEEGRSCDRAQGARYVASRHAGRDHPAQDWEQGRRPIVWSSNAFWKSRQVSHYRRSARHVRRLCELGVIAMKDSPNGKRWASATEDGFIVQAYGFDLGPLAARAQEFEMLHAQLHEERQFCASLRNTITVTRRIIRAKIDKAQESGLRGPWRELRDEFALMLQSLPKRLQGPKNCSTCSTGSGARRKSRAGLCDAFDWPNESDLQQAFKRPAEDTHSVPNSINMKPTDVSNDTHILTTKQLHPVKSTALKIKPQRALRQNCQHQLGLEGRKRWISTSAGIPIPTNGAPRWIFRC